MNKKVVVAGVLTSVAVLGGTASIGVAEAMANGSNHMEMNGEGHNFLKYNISVNDYYESSYRKENVKFDDGVMSLNFQAEGDGYTSGEYLTKADYGYGMYQVRMKPAKNSGLVSSFFCYKFVENTDGGDEIDIEFLGKDTTQVQFNYWNKGHGGHEYMYDLGFDASEDFHVYGYYWNVEGITWFVDGEPVYTAYQDIPDHAGQIMMNLWCNSKDPGWLGEFEYSAPVKAEYDWFMYDEADSVEEAMDLATKYLNKTE